MVYRTHQRPATESPRKIVIGLTGPIAAGKSTIAALIAERGAHIIDADEVYRSLLQPGSTLSRQIAEAFGSHVLVGNEIDRVALADIVFNDPEALATLERMTHPAVEQRIVEEVERSSSPLIVIEAIKLIQSGLADLVDSLWVVTANREVRAQRLLDGRKLTVAEANARMAASDSIVPSWVSPDVVIDNSDDIRMARMAVDAALAHLLEANATKMESERSAN